MVQSSSSVSQKTEESEVHITDEMIHANMKNSEKVEFLEYIVR